MGEFTGYDFSVVEDEILTENYDWATELEAQEADGTISDEDLDALNSVRDPFLMLINGQPTLDEVKTEVARRGLASV